MQGTETLEERQPQTECTLRSEQFTAKVYKELGTQISNLSAEREMIRDKEIIPELEAGVTFDYNGEFIVPEYIAVADFDWKRAFGEGAISKEVLDEYTVVNVQRRLNFRKLDDKGKNAYDQYLLEMREVYLRYQENKKAK